MSWVPQSCTLPVPAQPLRLAEFDALFAASLRSVERAAPDRLLLVLDGDAEAAARDLTARESACCSFFTFTVCRIDGEVLVEVGVPGTHVEVLDALALSAVVAAA
ncbi:hypothetical protein GCM10009836_71000 [Pseudonocardia ailaonensis]|uniref:Arsenate reductase n=1 Tax=Pseudonocardia ailaonensis TaxID=367279 RepID=A0ABN2NPC3_9PSEU